MNALDCNADELAEKPRATRSEASQHRSGSSRNRKRQHLCRVSVPGRNRISEQLGLCWGCVDFDACVVHIKYVQDKRTGKLIETTKTASGQRTIPLSETLRRMLAEWKPACPSLERVFTATQGGVLLYSSFRHRIWRPALQRMGLPPVSIHSARASFMSMLQASGVDVATAAKLAGHNTPNVTLQYYTHSLHDGRQAVNPAPA
jgi:integrase